MKEIGIDRKKLFLVVLALAAILLSVIFLPSDIVKTVAAALLTVAAVAVCRLVKKRSIHSFNKRQVLLLMAVTAAVYIMLQYLMGLRFGYVKVHADLSLLLLLRHLLPSAVIIVTIEIIRSVLLAQKSRGVSVLAYLLCVLSELLLFSGILHIDSIYRFMDLVGMTLFPAITANLLYHYISLRYGAAPNVVYRLLLSLYTYVIPFAAGIPEALKALLDLILPLAVLLFIDVLYEKRRRFALEKKSKVTYAVAGVLAVLMVSTVMLITCQFRFGMLVVATESMQGELNKGDAVVFESYDDQTVKEGDIILFDRGGDREIIHRVVCVQRINGQTRYYTKGDANEDWDYGYITDDQIKGIVLFKISYVGYPTLLLREAFH